MKIGIKKVLFWIIAVVITLGVAIYQRMTGPTYPMTYKFQVNSKEYKFKLPRSHNGTSDAMIRLGIEDAGIKGKLFFRRFKTGENMDTVNFHRENQELVAWLPGQPPAGKIEYGIMLMNEKGEVLFETPENLVIRFKNIVPVYVLIPHVLLIFTAMLLSNLTGLFAIANIPSYKIYTLLTLIFFLFGGMIMGPIVQKYAFGEYWTGFPFGKDLTDNKALVAFILWIIAWLGNRKSGQRRYLVILAALINLLIALIPHSMMGSELDYTTGEIETGMIIQFLNF